MSYSEIRGYSHEAQIQFSVPVAKYYFLVWKIYDLIHFIDWNHQQFLCSSNYLY